MNGAVVLNEIPTQNLERIYTYMMVCIVRKCFFENGDIIHIVPGVYDRLT